MPKKIMISSKKQIHYRNRKLEGALLLNKPVFIFILPSLQAYLKYLLTILCNISEIQITDFFHALLSSRDFLAFEMGV